MIVFFLGGGIFLAKSGKSCILRLVEPFSIIISSNTYSSSRSIQKHQNTTNKKGKKGGQSCGNFCSFFLNFGHFWGLCPFGAVSLFFAQFSLFLTHTPLRDLSKSLLIFQKWLEKCGPILWRLFFGGGFFRFFSFFGRKEVYLTNGNKHV